MWFSIFDARPLAADADCGPIQWPHLLRESGGWLLGACLMMIAAPHAFADLMLAPTRIVLEKNQRSAQLDLINNGEETATYRINLVNRRMSETGEFSVIDSPRPGEQFADELVRYSPRQVVLAPGRGQTVRILLRKPADLPAGEYRSHLQFDRVPEATGAASINAQGPALGPGEVGVQLTALIGVSIPVIVRHGDTSATVTLSGLELPKPAPGQPSMLTVVLQRSGNRSVYGDLAVMFTPQGGAAQEVGKAGGLAVYTPNSLRRVKLELKPPAGLTLTRGSLRVTFRERPDAGGKLLAEAAIELP
ncbi:MAG: molecular chaperone [Polaromonas sp.]|uniref:fimbrial biogenesis chaperone n=1 Tax=Polaromonas sp. TaxID=1869339 RepID=UPI0027180646|nr:molecular chaperone [Polaromonas sp.]MDO9114070.1 molecular chaperone [Polaromonas sp.]MDP1885804.1 molecular chaperone [Polaromonas sp.]MDP3224156.1 molecular chaperone [Rubrivivax sp.]